MKTQIAEGFKGEKAIITPYNIRSWQAENKITSMLYITHIGYYPNAQNHYRFREKGATENILILCERGKGWIEINEVRYTITENCFFIIPSETKHSYGSDPANPWSIYWFHYKGLNSYLFDRITAKVMQIRTGEYSRQQERIHMFNDIFHNLGMGYNPENLEYISFCLMHFMASLKYSSQNQEVKKENDYDIIQKSILYMKENLENKITLEDIASNAGYSTTHFNTLFTKRTSFSPIEYYNQLKIQRACNYLQFSDYKIKEISFRLNYYDPFHFSKSFSKEMEISPKEYRKRYCDFSKKV